MINIRQKLYFFFVLIFIITSCNPKITTQVFNKYPTTDFKQEINVFSLEDTIPKESIELGIVKIGDNGFSTNCDLEVSLEFAKLEARKLGGNAIKIIEEIPPSTWGSTCYRITAKILKVESSILNSLINQKKSLQNISDSIENLKKSKIDTNSNQQKNALLHIYRFGGLGSLVNYNLYLGEYIICRVSNNWKETISINKDGYNILMARTEVKEEIPIKIEFGKEYYIRCSVVMGLFVGHPKIEIIDNQIGKMEFQSIKTKKSKIINNNDVIILNDGREINCTINREDEINFYITIINNGSEVKTQINKNKIKSIQKKQ